MSREFECSREVELPATPEQVWEAITTGSGQAGWLWPSEIEPREGGRADLGTVTAYDPPKHFAVRAEGPDGWFNALEMVLEARDGGTTVMRYVHSGVFTDDWDTQYDAVGHHTDFYLHTLGQYLRYFPGRTAAYVTGDGPAPSTAPDALDTLRAGLGLGAGAAEGDRVSVPVEGLGPVEGTVDYLRSQFIGIRSDDTLHCFFARNKWGAPVSFSHHLFAEDADAEKTRQAWQSWLDGLYA